MDKLKMQSHDIIGSNIEKIAKLFPNCVTEVLDNQSGGVKLGVDFEKLKAELSLDIIAEGEERYQFTWPDKRRCIISSNLPISKTLRPCRYDSVDFNNTKNLYVEGDNLDVLKLLQETYLNKVKLIYIDPPYNAGADLLYKNNYEISEEEFLLNNHDINEDGSIITYNSDTSGRYHTDWLNMMYSRIKVARNLLSEDGCMVIAIDHNELANIIKVGDEIFSEKNRIGIVTVVHKPEGRNMDRYFATSNEFAIFYAKNLPMFDFEEVLIDEEYAAQYKYTDEKGKYRENEYIRLGGGDQNLRKNKPHFYYPIYVSPDLKEVTLEKKTDFYEIYPNTKSQERTWKTKKETTLEMIKQNELFALKNDDGEIKVYEKYRKGQLIKTHWVSKKYNAINSGTKILENLMKVKTFDFPKSLYLMKDIINMTTSKNSIVLDFFSGSATTAHAVMQLNAEDGGNRKFIMVQLPWECDNKSEAYKNGYKSIQDIAKERIRRAGNKIKEEVGLSTQNLDTGFRVLKLDSSNMEDVYYTPQDFSLQSLFNENVKSDRTNEDLLFQVMLDRGIELSARIESKQIAGKEVHFVDDNFLVACFDNNVNETTITEIAKLKPVYFVMRDSSAANDNVIDNFEQIFKHYSPDTNCGII